VVHVERRVPPRIRSIRGVPIEAAKVIDIVGEHEGTKQR
jgi:hypothetical protein